MDLKVKYIIGGTMEVGAWLEEASHWWHALGENALLWPFSVTALLPIHHDLSCFTILSPPRWTKAFSKPNLSSLKLFLSAV
jgi:hypothetical protein